MSNKEIAAAFRELGRIMELHGDNPFKIRSYQNAYMTLRKLDQPVAELSEEALGQIKGIGKAISGKIRELVETGEMATLEKWRAQTPAGVREMLGISGFGPKKVRTVWQELGVENAGELLYAVNENRLVELKGFGKKTQDDLKTKLEYLLRSRNQYHYATLHAPAKAFTTAFQQQFPQVRMEPAGAYRRACPTLEAMTFLIAGVDPTDVQASGLLTVTSSTAERLVGHTADDWPVQLIFCSTAQWGSKLFRHTGSEEFLQAWVEEFPGEDFRNLAEEDEVFARVNLPVIAPELREQSWGIAWAQQPDVPTLIQPADVRGVIHSHTTYSDGLHTLREMAEHARELGFGYLGITDHSKAAFYANGLSPERVLEQMAAIDALNEELGPDFRIFKGIESDILADGSLDYEEDLLRQFDFVIASIHSNLRMDEAKATTRLVKAIESPYTSILGHPTGRLLLSRPGYPIDHRRVIDACAAHGVHLELNANPYRLDLDWSWIPYAREKGVLISINPDAHSREGMNDIYYGTLAARKGGLTKAGCLNARTADEFYQLVHRW
jgi:DNA polymerase (family 10)